MTRKNFMRQKTMLEDKITQIQERINALEELYYDSMKQSVERPKDVKKILEDFGYADRFEIEEIPKGGFDGMFDNADFAYRLTIRSEFRNDDADALWFVIDLSMEPQCIDEEDDEEIGVFYSVVFEMDNAYEDNGSRYRRIIANSDDISAAIYYDYLSVFEDTLRWLCEHVAKHYIICTTPKENKQ